MMKLTPHLAEVTKLLRHLSSSKNLWIWDVPQEEAFTKVKYILHSYPVLALFDPDLDTVVSSDVPSFGFEAVLLQKQSNGT